MHVWNKLKNLWISIFGLCVLTSIIAIITFNLGCNPEHHTCPGYRIFSGDVTSTSVTPDVCKKCDSNNKCSYYTCYDANVYAIADTGRICKYQPVSNTNYLTASHAIKKYYEGKNVEWYRKSHSDICVSKRQTYQLWYVTIGLCSFILLCLFIGIVVTAINVLHYYGYIGNRVTDKVNKVIELNEYDDEAYV